MEMCEFMHFIAFNDKTFIAVSCIHRSARSTARNYQMRFIFRSLFSMKSCLIEQDLIFIFTIIFKSNAIVFLASKLRLNGTYFFFIIALPWQLSRMFFLSTVKSLIEFLIKICKRIFCR